MRNCRSRLTVLLSCALLLGSARADDVHKPPEDPDPSFLEFLGGVDGLAEANPDYLSQASAVHPPPPPPPKPAPTPPPPSSPGAKNNE